MEISIGQLGLLFQIVGVLLVFGSQMRFWYRVRKHGGLERAFFELLSVTRLGDKDTLKKLKKELKEEFPEKWTLANYFSSDLRTTSIGLVVTLIGLLLELSNLTITLP